MKEFHNKQTAGAKGAVTLNAATGRHDGVEESLRAIGPVGPAVVITVLGSLFLCLGGAEEEKPGCIDFIEPDIPI